LGCAPADAEDLVQSALARCYVSWATVRDADGHLRFYDADSRLLAAFVRTPFCVSTPVSRGGVRRGFDRIDAKGQVGPVKA
jgi:hypothetical protein